MKDYAIMELPFKPTEEAVNADWPVEENVKKWAKIWQEDGKEKAELILRHMAYVKKDIEYLLGGVSLSTIELVYLRHAATSALEACIRFDQLGDHPCFDAGIMPVNETLYQWFSICMDIDIPILNRFKNTPEFRRYLHKRYAALQDDTVIEPKSVDSD